MAPVPISIRAILHTNVSASGRTAAFRGCEHELVIHPALNQCDGDEIMRCTGTLGCCAVFQVARDCLMGLSEVSEQPSEMADYWLPPSHQDLW